MDKAMAEIKAGSGSHFDPELVTYFETLEPELRKIIADQGSD
jgi:response regulator RpfG family c-di-GMP phosphodiesterase